MNYEQLRRSAENLGPEFVAAMDAARARQHELTDQLNQQFMDDVRNPDLNTEMTLIAWLEAASELLCKLVISAGSSIPGASIEDAIKTMEKSIKANLRAAIQAVEDGAYTMVGGPDMVEAIKAAAKRGEQK